MADIILRRLAFMLLTILLVSLAIFFVCEVVPVDVARNILGQFATEETITAFREKWGLNCPAPVRYAEWLAGDDWVPAARGVLGEAVFPTGCTPEGLERRGILRGDLGYSLTKGTAVAPLLFRNLGNSAVLAGLAFLFIIPISLILGLIAGLKEGTRIDNAITLGGLITTSTPNFALGVLLIVIFSLKLGWLPGNSALLTENSIFETPVKLIMPVTVLFFEEAGYVIRMTRASMVEVMRTPYIRTALLKGMPYKTVVFKHALKNALLAPITVIMLHISWLIGGVVVVESLFGFPGLGTLMLQSALRKDVYMLEAGTLFLTVIATSTQLISDLIYIYLNPKIRYS